MRDAPTPPTGARRLRLVVATAAAIAGAVLLPVAPAAGAPGGATGGIVAQQDPGGGPQVPVNPEIDPDDTRERADEILRGREYQAPEARDRTVFERIRRWFGDRAPDWDGPSEGQGRGFSYTILIVVGTVAAVALFFALKGSRFRRRAPDVDDAEIEVTPLRSPTEWTAEADRCEREGDHRGAVRARFRALTTTLARRDLVGDTPGRTAGELRADIAERAPALSGPFDALAGLFEVVWYGRADAGPSESTRARELAATVLDAAPRRRGRHDGDLDADTDEAPEPVGRS